MKVITEAKTLRDALFALQPTRVAVAFVGSGWRKYISPMHLKEIVVSPTLGSNPKAIEELMAEIGDENVHFLDQLHSKIYLGHGAALLGSNNLSDNGLADVGLMEAAVQVNQPDPLRQLEAAFRDYKEKAKELYPNSKAKKEKLRVLMAQWNTATWHGFAADGASEPDIANYKSGLDRIHIAWYQSFDLEYDKDTVNKAIPESTGVSLDDYFLDAMQFLEEDSVAPGDWILCWRCRNDGYPRKDGKVSWMHVHAVVPHGVVDDDYTKLVGQARHLKCGPPPFRLDAATAQLVRDALSTGDFPELLPGDGPMWRLGPADTVTPRFIAFLSDLAKAK